MDIVEEGGPSATASASEAAFWRFSDPVILCQPGSVLFQRSRITHKYMNQAMECEFIRYSQRVSTIGDRICLLYIVAYSLSQVALWSSVITVVGNLLNLFFAFAALLADEAVAYVYHLVNRDAAFAHEAIVWGTLMCAAVLFGFLGNFSEGLCQRPDYFAGHTTAAERHDACVHAISPYVYFPPFISAMNGRPRFMLMCTYPLAYLATRIITRPFSGGDSTEEAVMKLVMDAAVLLTTLACHYVREWARRDSFEDFVCGLRAMQQAGNQKKRTELILSNFLPPVLFWRVLSREHFDDSGACVTVLVAAVADLALWVPASASATAVGDAVSRVSELMRIFERHQKRFGVERIYSTGDEYLLTSNLIVATINHALRIIAVAGKVRPCLASCGVPVRCAVHSGSVRGCVSGSRYWRYDVSGEGVDVARKMLDFCTNQQIIVSSSTKELVRDRALFTPCEDSLIFASQVFELYHLAGIASSRVKVPAVAVSTEDPNSVPISQDSAEFSSSQESDLSRESSSPRSSSDSTTSSSRRVHFDESTSGLNQEGESSRPKRYLRNRKHNKENRKKKENDLDEQENEEGQQREDADAAPVAACPITKSEESDLEMAKLLQEEGLKLTLESAWHGSLRFADSSREAQYKPTLALRQILVANISLLVLSSVAVVLLFVEMKGVSSHSLAGQVLCICVPPLATAFILGMLYMAEPRMSRPRDQVVVLAGTALLCILFSCGVVITRRGLIVSDTLFVLLKVVEVMSVATKGMPWKYAAGYAASVGVCHFLLSIGFNSSGPKIIGLVFVAGLLAVVFPLARWEELFLRQSHRDERLVQFGAEMETKEKENLQCALAAVIPTPLVEQLTCAWGIEVAKSGVLEHVRRGIVVALRFHSNLAPGSDKTSPTATNKGDGPACNVGKPNVSRRGSRRSSSNKELPCFSTSAETILRSFAYLNLIKMVGDHVLAAGPLQESHLNDAAAEAVSLLEQLDGQCTSAATIGEFYAVVTGGTQGVCFFLVGDAIHCVKVMMLAASPFSRVYSNELTTFLQSVGGDPAAE